MSLGERVPLETALVRVWRGDVPVGAGFLAGPAHVLTAAHVVSDALGSVSEQMPSAGSLITVDFPLLAPERRQLAEVVAWRPPVPGLGMDIAGLRLLEPPPEGARPLVLSRRRAGLNGPLVMVGFPRGLELGTWVYGREGGPVATGWVEIESDPTRQATLAPGFSGTPVWSPATDAVVGMVGYKVTGAGSKIGYMVPVDALLTAWPDLVDLIEQRAPFRALRAFGEQDAELFYGRDELVEQIVDRIRAAVPVIGVIGGSGAGKSSLWHAGVVPRLRAERGLLVATLRPSDASTPLNALAFALDRLLEPDRSMLDRLDSVAGLAQRLARSGAVSDVVAALLDRSGADRLLICVDQFEEVFGSHIDDRAAFVGALRACLTDGSRLSVLVNVRDTFLGAALSDPSCTELARRWLPITVGEMTEGELRRVMAGPLERVGTVGFADGLVERILQDLRRTPSPLPLLEFTLAELWDRRSAGRLTHESYEQVGGVSRALAGYAERVWAGLDPATRTTAERLLVQLARPLPRDELTVRRTALRSECDEAQWTVAQRLSTTRLLVLHEVNSGRADEKPVPGVELAHDSLLTQWDRLRALTDEFREFRVWQDGLRQRIDTWTSRASPNSRLLSGADLRDARRWAASHGEHLGARERSYIAVGTRHRRRLFSAVAVVLVLALTTATVVYEHRSKQVAEAIAKDLAAKAQQLRTGDAFGAVQLAMRAYRTDSSVGLDGAALGGYRSADKLVADEEFVRSPDAAGPTPSSVPAPGASRGTATPTNPDAAASGQRVQSEIESLSQAVSADGRTLVTTDPAGQIVLWHLSGRQVQDESLAMLSGPSDISGPAVISPSGRYVAFRQTVMPNIDTKNVNGPVDRNGLPRIDPSRYRTCVPAGLLSMVHCLVVYDTLEHRVALAEEVPQLPMLGGVILSIDPTDQVVGMVVADSLVPNIHSGLQNTLYLFDLRTGRPLRQVRLPWPSMVVRLWLGAGGTTATVADDLLDDLKGRADLSLSFVDLGQGTVSRRQLVDDPTTLHSVAMSLDGGTVAALIRDPRDGTGQLVAWSTATGAVTRRLPRIVPAGTLTTLALDATGSAAWISTLPQDLGVLRATNALQVPQEAAKMAWQVSVRSLSDGTESGPFAYPGGAIWPLGSGIDTPLALVNGTMLGLVLPHSGEPAPLRRVAAATTDPHPAGGSPTMAELCALLGEPNQDGATHDLAPSGAYQGKLCP